MSVPLWVVELAAEFWELAGTHEPFPRRLREPIRRALPLDLIDRPGLSLGSIRAWLARRRIAWELDGGDDRRLRACLLAHRGRGLVFVDSEDPDDEQRFSLSHEAAHFLRDYLRPRRQAVARLGPGVLEVLDGVRPPTTTERLHGLLAGISVGGHIHLLERDPAGRARGIEAEAEDAADRLALELLAPAAEVQARSADRPGARAILIADFGLPAAWADAYTDLLFPLPPRDPFLERLREILKK